MAMLQHFEDTIREVLMRVVMREHVVTGEVGLLERALGRVTVSIPTDDRFGDLTTNAALVLSRVLGRRPRDLAELLGQRIRDIPDVRDVSIEGGGFINIRLEPRVWYRELVSILRGGVGYGDCDMGGGLRVNIEYVSANPTGPLHVAHARGAILGDVLANLLRKVGFDVTREFYVNDVGNQVEILARSVYERYLEGLGIERGISLRGLYPGEYLRTLGWRIAETYGDRWCGVEEGEWLGDMRDMAIEYLLGSIREDLRHLGVIFDCYTSERGLLESGIVEEVLAILRDEGYIYEGFLEAPVGQRGVGRDDEGEVGRVQLLFRSTSFGDDLDRPLRKADGTGTYFVHDIAYHFDKFRRGFVRQIDVWGADHGGYVKRLRGAVSVVTQQEVDLDVKLCQLVHVVREGKLVRMSKRTGDFITLRELLDDVGRDVLRFIMLTRSHDQTLEFDCLKVKEESRDNMVFYVQYAHARCCSVLRYAVEMFGEGCVEVSALVEARLSLLTQEEEILLIRLLARWPKIVRMTAQNHELHRIAYYLYEVASSFHELWTKGKKDATLRFLLPDERVQTLARVALIKGVATVIASGLHVMGITPVEELRS